MPNSRPASPDQPAPVLPVGRPRSARAGRWGAFALRVGIAVGLSSLSPRLAAAAPAYPDRFVWVFGWNLGRDAEVAEIARLLETAASHQLNGAVVSLGLDTLCQKSPEFFHRLDDLRAVCERDRIDLVPSIFSIGYGGGILSHDRNLAEGLPVQDAPFVVQGRQARFQPDVVAHLTNGGFEFFTGHRFKGFNFHDDPGRVSFADTTERHGGQASLRLENFGSSPGGHGRVMQEVVVQPQRSYRFSIWVKTAGLAPANAFRLLVLGGDRDLAPRTFKLPATSDWRRLSLVFNSLGFDRVKLYAGLWEGRAGKVWLDEWSLEEIGPVNVLHRPGTPVRVCSADGSVTYTEDQDFAPLVDPQFQPWRDDGDAVPLKLLPGSRIQDGQRLRVSWYHSMLLNDSQVTACMAEPALDAIFDHEAQLLAQHLHPRRVLLNMDEVRLGGTCAACRGRDMAQLLGECVTRQVKALRRHLPEVQIYVWSDMFDPNHNAHPNYYLVEGDFTGSWKHLPKDLVIAVWGGAPRPKSLRFFADQGFRTLGACYYDAADLRDVRGWIEASRGVPGVQGFMYTPWEKNYALLPEFGDLLQSAAQP